MNLSISTIENEPNTCVDQVKPKRLVPSNVNIAVRGTSLTPPEWRNMIDDAERGVRQIAILDVRNGYEWVCAMIDSTLSRVPRLKPEGLFLFFSGSWPLSWSPPSCPQSIPRFRA